MPHNDKKIHTPPSPPLILKRMEGHIQNWQQTNDQRQTFLSCYMLMTGNMLKAVEEGQFRDKIWVGTLLHNFADYYFDALTCYDCGDNVPRVWQQVHHLTTHHKLHWLQYLLSNLIRHWRPEVWNNTQLMLSAPDDIGRETLRQKFETQVMRRAELLSL